MLSVERVKELLSDPSLSDTEIEQIRDEFQILAEIIFEKWRDERIQAKKEKGEQRPEENKKQITLDHHAKQNQ